MHKLIILPLQLKARVKASVQGGKVPCLPARIEEGPALQPHDWLDQMPLGFLSSPIVHHLPEGTRPTAGFVPSPTYPDAWTSQSVRVRLQCHK